MRTLRTRLILSHILPMLVIVPLVGIALLYILETQVLLANLSEELKQQAALTADLASDHPDIWNDATKAHVFVTRFSAYHQSQLMLLDPKGKLLASSSPEDTAPSNGSYQVPDFSAGFATPTSQRVSYNQNLQVEVTEVLVPVIGPNQEIIGIVRLSHQLSTVHDRFLHLRYIIIGVLGGELLLGVVVGLVLALDLERSLRSVTEAISGVASGGQWIALPERGPEEIRMLLRAFNSLSERLRMLEEARRRLLANLVHEVGRPMGALQSAIQALLNGADQDHALRRELLEGMEAEVQRLHPLLDNLAKLHDRVLGTLELNCRPTDLNAWLPRTVAPWREAAHAKGLLWQATLPDSLPTLEIDPDRLAQVVGNLLSNAIKYTPAGGTVSITAGFDENKGVWLRVSDTGLGIDPVEQMRIFEPFHRSHPGRRFPQGMGLGLTIAKDLTAAHGGWLEVESEPGAGSHFTVWLPLDTCS